MKTKDILKLPDNIVAIQTEVAGKPLRAFHRSEELRKLGIPRVLARLEDRIFEALHWFDVPAAKAWPARFIAAPKTGANLEMVWPRFAAWLLVDENDGVLRLTRSEKAKEAIKAVAALYACWIEGNKPNSKEWRNADAAAAAARNTIRIKQADKLIELMQQA